MPDGTGFDVDIQQLRDFSGKLSGHKTDVNQVKSLVGQADVGDQSWGVVGLFVFDKYKSMLGDLNMLMGAMESGLQIGSEKFTSAADIYQQTEDDHEKTWKDLTGHLDVPVIGPAN
jgi:hypothetical protein